MSKPLFEFIFSNIDSLTEPHVIFLSELKPFQAEAVQCLINEELLLPAKVPTHIRCPEEGCQDCWVELMFLDGQAYISCEEQGFPLHVETEELKTYQLNFRRLGEVLTESLRVHLKWKTIEEGFSIGHKLGKELIITVQDEALMLSCHGQSEPMESFIGIRNNHLTVHKKALDQLLCAPGKPKETQEEKEDRIFWRLEEIKAEKNRKHECFVEKEVFKTIAADMDLSDLTVKSYYHNAAKRRKKSTFASSKTLSQ